MLSRLTVLRCRTKINRPTHFEPPDGYVFLTNNTVIYLKEYFIDTRIVRSISYDRLHSRES